MMWYKRRHHFRVAHAPEGYVRSPSWVGSIAVGRLQNPCWARNSAEILVDQRQRFGFVNFAGYDQNGIIGLVVFLVKCLKVIDGHFLNVGAVADGRFAVVVPQVSGRHNALVQYVLGGVFAHFKFIPNNRKLGVEVFFLNERIHHPVGFQIERPFQVLVGGREGFEVIRAVEPGRAVRAGAVRRSVPAGYWCVWSSL